MGTNGGVGMSALLQVDIFATKGIEYLLIIFFLIVFIVFIRVLFKSGRKGKKGAGEDKHEG
jgi:hypothetical protein